MGRRLVAGPGGAGRFFVEAGDAEPAGEFVFHVGEPNAATGEQDEHVVLLLA